MTRPKVTRRIVGRSAILDVDLDSPRLTYRLEAKWYDTFFERYPAVTNAAALHAELLPALELQGIDAPPELLPWLRKQHPRSGIFDGIAHWSRVERAHRESWAAAQQGDRTGAGLTLPARQPMPVKLAEMLAEKLAERDLHPRT